MIEIRSLTLSYGEKQVLQDFSLSIPAQGVTALSGPSGCGKTTLMRCIAGLEAPLSGHIAGISPTQAAILFQENRLLPWRTVKEHISDVLSPQQRGRAQELLKLVGLESEAHQFPASLSGGMGRRLALARCLALKAGLYLLDEPFTGVDLERTARLMEHLRTLSTPVLLSTHEPEVLSMADRVIYLDGPPLHTTKNHPGSF